MENLEKRIQKLEKKYNTLKYLVACLTCFSAYTGVATMNTLAIAQSEEGGKAGIEKIKPMRPEELSLDKPSDAKTKAMVEAQRIREMDPEDRAIAIKEAREKAMAKRKVQLEKNKRHAPLNAKNKAYQPIRPQEGKAPLTRIQTAKTAQYSKQNLQNTASQNIDAKEAGIPIVVEAQAFILRDEDGNIRGFWSADADTTSFAMTHNQKHPMIGMAVDSKNASLSLTDVYGGKINASLTDSVRSIAIADETKKNSVYMGLTGSGETSLDMVSTGKSAVSIDGDVSSIDLTGNNSVIALSETVGSAVALKAMPATSAITFLDHSNKTTMDLTTIDGRSQIKLISPEIKQEKTITSAPEVRVTASTAEHSSEVVGLNAGNASAPNSTEKKEEKKVDMKSYSPFSSSK